MALKIKSLGSGTITTSGTTTLYTADATTGQQKSAIVGSIIFSYTHTSSVNVKIMVTSGATTAQFYPTTALISSGTKRLAVTDKITLGPGEKIEVNLSLAPPTGAFAWCISGFERDTGM